MVRTYIPTKAVRPLLRIPQFRISRHFMCRFLKKNFPPVNTVGVMFSEAALAGLKVAVYMFIPICSYLTARSHFLLLLITQHGH